MRKRLLALGIIIMAAALLFSACGKKDEASGNIKMAEIEALLSNDYEAEYIFAMAGLSVDNAKALKATDGGVYYPVQSDKYKVMADLSNLLAATYGNEETTAAYLGRTDAKGLPLYMELEGKLCRSGEPLIGEFSPEADYETIEKGKLVKGKDGLSQSSFTISESSAEGGEYRCVMEVTRGKDGKWRLATTRGTAVREIVKEGSGEVKMGVAGELAKKFVDALGAGDTAAIEQLTQAHGGSYGYLAQAGVTSASFTVTSETDYDGEYIVTIEVSGGNGTFAEGKHDYRMEVGYSDYDGSLVVRYLQPRDFVSYDRLSAEQQTYAAANQVTALMRLAGNIKFASNADLAPETVTEYILWLDETKNGPNEDGMTLGELGAQAKKYFGIDGFDPGRQSTFYNTATDSYFMLGRGLAP
ncbi:MAG: hypothetical protein RR049_06725, partial [Angelakisella sp.]